jgi:hypothetical protein
MKNFENDRVRGITLITLNQFILLNIMAAVVDFLLCLLIFGCVPVPVPGPPVDPEGGTEDDCPAACANLQDLKCPGWRGSPGPDGVFDTEDDISCVDVCVYTMTVDETMTLFPLCTAQAETCEEVEECFEGGY